MLYPAPLLDLLVRIAATGIVTVKWTDAILDECFRSILKNRPGLKAHQLGRTRDLMNKAVRDVVVCDYEPLIAGLKLPDADDRHVLAAAIRCGAQTIITANLKDFPAAVLHPLGVEAIHPDDFI
ncbi:MAG: hypothetical protein ACI9OJ_003936, partial [Myxococcota bacterium]